ncbi:hypothetical protein [Winogradskyella tangerina]|uniref:hypothetical protein n=1 Tax=Winogradskyella tangerina TaxID=2023240 RepID=UPI0013005539|nr:hypothetical protein [Winogradskyella tangerina]
MKSYLLLLMAFLSLSCNSQEDEQKKSKISEKADNKENVIPKGSWKVNKEFDENGNLTRIDSVYSWSSSGSLKDIDADSIFNKLQSKFEKRLSMSHFPRYSGFMKHDSIMKQFFSDDFLKDDFFSSGMPLGMPNMDDMMKRMEAMRQQFFNENNRYIIPPEKKNIKKDNTKTIKKKQV